MNKWTQGPWEVEENSWAETSIYSEQKRVCEMSIREEATEDTEFQFRIEMNANAHLIASAPMLYEALETIINNLPTNKDWLNPDDEKFAKQALAKARGE